MCCSDGNLVINPFDPNSEMQQWIISERRIQNRSNPDVVLQARAEDITDGTCQVTSGEYNGSEVQLWNINHVYVSFCFTCLHDI